MADKSVKLNELMATKKRKGKGERKFAASYKEARAACGRK